MLVTLLVRAEHAGENRIDVAGVVAEVEQGRDLRRRQVLADLGIGVQQVEELAAAVPCLHGVALHRAIGVLAAGALLGQGQQHALRVDDAAARLQVGAHPLGIDHQLLDHAGGAGEREVERDGGVRPEHPLDPEWEMSRSCHRATFSSAGTTAARMMRASPVRFSVSTGLRLCGIADEPFWPGAKYSSASRTSVRCRWRISIASRSMPLATTPSTAKNMACRSRGMTWVETGSTASRAWPRHAPRPGVDVGEGADRARDGAGGDLPAGGHQPVAVAVELGIVPGQLQAEGGRLGMDGVAAADADRVLVLDRAAPQGGQDRVDILQQEVAGLDQLHGKAGVEHVGRGHALVDEACLRPDMLGRVGQEGDHVVARLALDRVDALDLEAAALPDRAGGLGRDHPSSACASQAWASISNQMRNRFCGSQMAAMRGRL